MNSRQLWIPPGLLWALVPEVMALAILLRLAVDTSLPTGTERILQVASLWLVTLALIGTGYLLWRRSRIMGRLLKSRDEVQVDLLRSILGSTRYMVVSTDLEGRITSINPSTEAELGWSFTELRRNESTPILFHDPEEISRRAAEQNRRWGTALAPGFSTFIAPLERQEVSEAEWWFVRRNGTRFRVHLSVTAIRNQDNTITGYLGVARDKTEELGLEQERRLLQRAVEASPTAVLITDIEGVILYANPILETISGYPREELLGQPSHMLESDLNAPGLDDEITQTTLRGESWCGEICNRRKDGSLYWIEATISSIFDSAGNLANFVSVIEDVTLRRQALDELQRAKDNAENMALAKTDFLSTMSHEIRTPLNALVGVANLLALQKHLPEQEENIRLMRSSGQHLTALVNDILDFSKIEAGRLELESHPFSCRELCQSVIDNLQTAAVEKGISLDLFWYPECVDWILGDSVRLRQVLTNLIGNAVKFTHEGGVILRVRALQRITEECGHEFSISDTGIGIARAKIDSIFERFSQAEASTTRRFGGTGLGLSISSRLVQAMGGTLAVESNEGKGSTFRFQIKSKIGSNLDEAPAETDTKAGLAGYCILLVEDNPVNVLIAGQFLDLWGVRWIHAENGKIAVEVGLSQSIDLVLMDLQMPVMDGYEATRRLREGGFKAPILALTASALNDRRQMALDLGMNDFVTKPFAPEDLESKLLHWIR